MSTIIEKIKLLWYIERKFDNYSCCMEGGFDSIYERVSESIEAWHDDGFMFIDWQLHYACRYNAKY
jgi:hypothetical protein